jgi:type I restriction enzyme S subunit
LSRCVVSSKRNLEIFSASFNGGFKHGNLPRSEEFIAGYVTPTGFAVISPKNNLEPKFLHYLLSSESYIDHVMANSVGVTYPAINSSDLGRFPCLKPPLKEAEKISKFLFDETTHLDNLISKSQSQINILQEKRQALITSAVTGKIDVRK